MLTMVISRQKSEIWLPNVEDIKGMSALHEMIESGAERSVAHRNDLPRSSIADGKKLNMAMSIGICSSMGRQPDIGLAPARE